MQKIFENIKDNTFKVTSPSNQSKEEPQKYYCIFDGNVLTQLPAKPAGSSGWGNTQQIFKCKKCNHRLIIDYTNGIEYIFK